MKNTLFTIIIFILVLTSCSKNNTSGSGSWTFKGVTYNTVSAYSSNGSFLIATNLTGTDSATYSSLELEFDGSSLPTSSGTYTVVNAYPAAANQVAINLSIDGVAPNTKYYASTGASGTLTVTVSVSGGKVTVSGSGIEMLNTGTSTADASDSTSLSFNVTH